MKVYFTSHAIERADRYHIPIVLIKDALQNPDTIIGTYKNRKIFQKRLNGNLLRVIIKESKEIYTVITVYKSRRERYEI